MNLYPYDIETYPNVFTCTLFTPDGARMVFEISDRTDDTLILLQWFKFIADQCGYLVGFNNESFDYYVVHGLIENPSIGYQGLYDRAIQVISHRGRFPLQIWPRDRYVKQLDLYKIHHFDNPAKRTSLKIIEFNMRMSNIRDLPFEPGLYLTNEQIDVLRAYNVHDVEATADFMRESMPMIEFRHELIETLGPDVINYNDTKIGKQFFIKELEKHGPNACYSKINGQKVTHQTPRAEIKIADIIFDYVQFESVEFSAILDYLKTQTITETKSVPALNIAAHFAGVLFQFGTGGMHASVEGAQVFADDDNLIIDLDVTSYYPSLAIANRVYPEHLGENFCNIYGDLKQRRTSFAKGSAQNAMLKLALNGVYGDSNNEYSPFYDPQYTMSITINGQLLLCMLAEQLHKIPELKLIQVNTDGLTVKVPKRFESNVMQAAAFWEKRTGLDLERADYSKMFIRDVNNYFAVTTDGKTKRKSAYCHERISELGWHKDHGGLVIPKAAEAFLLHGVPVDQFLRNHDDLFDFCFRAKVPRSSRLELRTANGASILQNVTRYIVTNGGGQLVKIMPPLPKKPDHEREIGICVGQNVTELNDLVGGLKFAEVKSDIDFAYYEKEAFKLIKGVSLCRI